MSKEVSMSSNADHEVRTRKSYFEVSKKEAKKGRGQQRRKWCNVMVVVRGGSGKAISLHTFGWVIRLAYCHNSGLKVQDY